MGILMVMPIILTLVTRIILLAVVMIVTVTVRTDGEHDTITPYRRDQIVK